MEAQKHRSHFCSIFSVVQFPLLIAGNIRQTIKLMTRAVPNNDAAFAVVNG